LPGKVRAQFLTPDSPVHALKPPIGNPDNEMKRSHTTVFIITLFLLVAPAGMVSAAITTFDYTQTDSITGSGTIAPPAQSIVGGVTITWSQTVMPQASVRDPSGAGNPGGAVGGFNAQEGLNGGNGQDVAIYWNASTLSTSGASTAEPVSVDILGSGSDGNSYSVAVSLVFFGDNVLPDENFPGWGNNDFHWSLEYGDILGTNPEGSPRTAMWLSPTFALTVGGRAQRYTQNTNALTGVLTNTDTSSGAEKDAFDQNGNTVATAAIGQPLEFGFGWRDRDSVTGGPVLVDNFNVQGLLEYKLANVTVIDTRGFQILEMTYSPGDKKASFSWPSSEGQNFIIERSADFIFWEELDDTYPAAEAPADTTTYEDNNLVGAGKMFYRVTRL
jgi:hypothetical protein